ncbi:MAG: HepT-like ribonuclease domain-containing protein [Dehalococcoidia bacterium]|jgi:uncharacterized protein with HEPN domain
MQLEAKKYLYDIAEAAEQIAAFTADRTLADYEGDAMLRSAVERQFEIVGEALGQLARLDEAIATRITDYRRIIAFRNILIHGYAQVDDRLVWDVVETSLPALRREVAALLEE